MDSIELLNKETGEVRLYDIHLGNTPQTIEVAVKGGEARGYTSLATLSEKYEIVRK